MFTNYPVLSRVAVLILDTIITVASYVVAMNLRTFLGLSDGLEWNYYVHLLLIIMIIWGGLSEYQEAYAGKAYRLGIDQGSLRSLRKELIIVFRTILIGCPMVYVISYVINLFTPWEVPKSLIVIFAFVNILLLFLEKVIIFEYVSYNSRKSKNIKKVLILGTGDVASDFIDSKKDNKLEIIGLIGKEPCRKGETLYGYNVLGCYKDFVDILHSNYIDELVIALPAKYLGEIEEVINRCDREGIPVRIVSPFFRNLISKSKAEVVYGIPNIIFQPVERNDLELVLKRFIDIMVSFAGLIVLAPLFALIAFLIKIDSPGPVFYKWKILGHNKKPLTSYKFRTMVKNADELKEELMAGNEMKGAAFKMSNDPRITRIGKFLRKYSFDELPQLWSVFIGDLSLVGPRPPLQSEVELFAGWHRRKLSVKPGMTCIWQISGRNEISDFNDWIRLDLQYIDDWNLWLDLKILFKTIPAIIKGSGK